MKLASPFSVDAFVLGGGISEGCWRQGRVPKARAVSGSVDTVLDGLCSALFSVGTSDWDWIRFSVKSPNSKLDLQNWQRVPELSQFPPELDIVLFLCPTSLLRS